MNILLFFVIFIVYKKINIEIDRIRWSDGISNRWSESLLNKRNNNNFSLPLSLKIYKELFIFCLLLVIIIVKIIILSLAVLLLRLFCAPIYCVLIVHLFPARPLSLLICLFFLTWFDSWFIYFFVLLLWATLNVCVCVYVCMFDI